MDRTVLTLAVDSSQVGTAAAAFDRMVNAGNSAATSAGRVTSATALQGRTISQSLIPALTNSINRTRTLDETQRAMGQDASRQVAQASPVRAQPGFASSPAPQVTAVSRALPNSVQGVSIAGTTDLAQLTGGASSARTAIERLTTAARNDRNALVQLTPAAAAAAGSYRQLASTPIRLDAQQGLSAASAALGNLSDRAANARRAIADLGRSGPAAPTTQPAQASGAAPRTGNAAPSPAGMNAFAAATAHGTTATNAFTAAQGRAAEAAQHLAEANARNEAAQARLAAAVQRAATAQAALNNASRSGSGSTESVAAQTRLQSAQAAVSVATANVARTQRTATEAAERHRIALQATGRQSTLTANQTQQLHFQLHDFFVQVISGQSPLTAFVQQGSQLSGTFNGAGGALRAVMSIFTPMRLALGGVAGAIAAVGYAFYEGARQSKAFSDAVTLTGNYAGQTAGQLTALTREIASHGQATASAAREAAQALISSGQVGPQVFAAATEAVTLYAQATGQTAEDVVKDFASMARAPSKWAEEHNRALHFITAAQYESIKAFEDAGKSADAQGVIYAALNERLHKLDDNIGYLGKVLRNGKSLWSQFWDSAYDIGRPETIEGKIASISAKVQAAQRDKNPFAPAAQSRTAQLAQGNKSGSADALQYELQDQLAGQQVQQANAFNEAAKAEAQQAAITATAVVDGYLKRGKAASVYNDKLAELNRSFKAKSDAGTPVSAADQKVALTQLKKDFTPAKGAGSGEAQQVLRAQLETDIKGIKDVLDREKDRISFQQRFLDSVYQSGQVSLKDFYNERRTTIAEGVDAELAELDKEIARLEQYKKATKDPSEKVVTQTRINEVGAQKEKISTAASRDVVLVNQEEAASFKALGEQVINYRGNLLQMQGDEAGAAALRAQTVIANAKVLAAQANALPGAPKVDVEALTRAITITDQFSEVQRQTSLLTSSSARAEEAYLLTAERSGKSLVETERGLYAVRSSELAQLGALAQKAKELADASTDPKIKAFASDLALEYAKAASAIDPALNRLRDARRELAAGLANTAGQAPSALIEEYSKRRQGAADDIKRQQDEYSRKIDILEGYLATTQDKTDKARLRERIKAEEAKRDSVKGESKGKSILGAINDVVVQPMAKQVFDTVNKLLITDPLQKYLEGQLKGLTENGGMLAGFFQDALGIKADPKQTALLQQTAAINASSSALDALKTAAESAANALNQPLVGNKASGSPAAGSAQGAGDPTQPPPVDADLAGVQSEATQSLAEFSKQATSTASDVVKLANAAGAGGNAMVRLPGIVGLFQSAVAAMQASSAASSGGGLFGSIAKLFGSSGGEAGAYEAAVASSGIFHSGGIVGQPPATRNVSMSTFAGAPRYHTGGVVGKAADKVSEQLKHNEVPAILMGGPKGRREEVLRADDPRHRDNLGMSIVARILAESKSSKHSASKEVKTSESRSPVATLLQSIAGSKGKGESSANVLGSLLDRLGVKEGRESPVANAIKVRGARELGGPVSAGGMYRVNEKGPELLQVAGKQYLMTGAQGGSVVPHGAAGKGGDTTVVHVNVTPPAGGSAASAQQWGAMAGRQIQRATRRNT